MRQVITIMILWGGIALIPSTAQLSIDEAIASLYQMDGIVTEHKSVPLIDEINIRSATRDWLWREQEYSLRISPISWKERSASNRLLTQWQQELYYVKQEHVARVVRSLHRDWVDQSIAQMEQSLLEQRKTYLFDKKKVLEKESIMDTDLLTQLLQVRASILSIDQEINSLSIKVEQIYTTMRRKLGDVELQTDTLDRQAYIEAAMEAIISTDDLQISAADQLDIDILESEISLEKAEESRVLDFMQLEYQGPHDDEINERLRLGISVNIPYRTSSRLSIAKLMIEKEREAYEQQISLDRRRQEYQDITSKLKMSVEEYQSQKRLITQSQQELSELINGLARQEVLNPRIYIDYQLQMVDHQLVILDMEERIIQRYLDLLQVTNAYDTPMSFIVAR